MSEKNVTIFKQEIYILIEQKVCNKSTYSENRSYYSHWLVILVM